MKKTVSIILILTLIILMSACGSVGSVNRVYDGQVNIPEDGIINAEALETMKKNSSVAVFTGTSGDFLYSWSIFGDDIEIPNDINLSATLTQQGDDIKVTFLSDCNFGFSPLFTVTLPIISEADSFRCVSSSGVTVEKVSLTKKNTSVISFTPPSQTGSYILTPVFSSVICTEESTMEEITTEQQTTAASEPDTTKQVVSESTTRIPVTTTLVDVTTTQSTPTVEITTTAPAVITTTPSTTKESLFCSISIECSSILNNISELDSSKLSQLPSDGIILSSRNVEFNEGDSVFDVLNQMCRENSIHLEYSMTTGSAYIEGIHNLYEFDCGALSGWMYRVNGVYPNFSCSDYKLKNGDVIEWRYTCDLGHDIGGGF